MCGKTYNVLFLCTHNSARSILAETYLNHVGKGRFFAYSAGSHPSGSINPMTTHILRRNGYAMDGLRSKSWDEFAVPGAPKMDFVITVCDTASGEVCPVWPGQPMTAHWGFEDPLQAKGTEKQRRRVFQKVFQQIQDHIQLFLSLPIEQLDALSLQQRLKDIGKSK
jgi:arsenate reductase (thioredoxin)